MNMPLENEIKNKFINVFPTSVEAITIAKLLDFNIAEISISDKGSLTWYSIFDYANKRQLTFRLVYLFTSFFQETKG
jgi:hypothetical protein